MLGSALVMLTVTGCSSSTSQKPQPLVVTPLPPPAPSPPPQLPEPPPRAEVLPEAFESSDFFVTVAKPGDTPESLATRYLGSPGKAWMIEDYIGVRSFPAGVEVVIPKRDWNPPGVYPSGYQVVPVLVYHNIGAQRKGRLLIASSTFEEQMRYLKAEGYHAIRLVDFLDYLAQKRQLPKKSVMITFDDGHKGFLQYAQPVLKEMGFPAVLFIQSDQIAQRPNASSLSWPELRELLKDNVEVQAHSKTHGDLRRAAGEAEPAYARRMQAELGIPLALLRAQLPEPTRGRETIAYPYGEWDDGFLRYVKQYGYSAGFTVRREANAAFIPPFRVNRSQIFSDLTMEEFAKNLNTFQQEPLLSDAAPANKPPQAPAPSLSIRQQWAARHNRNSEAFMSRGMLRQALDESKIALTIDPTDTTALTQQKQLESRIESEVAARMQQGGKVPGADGRRQFLAALALNPASATAFDAVRNSAPPPEAPRIAAQPAKSLTHTVRPNETPSSLADLYYGDRSLAEVIERANGLKSGAPLAVGRQLKIPEVAGIPFLRPD